MNVRYRVELSQAERDQLTEMLSGGKHAARKLKRAQILLAAASGVSETVIAASVRVGESTVYRTKRRFVEGNLELALSEEPRPGCGRKLTGKEEALLIATACSSPPEGRARWTLELLAGEMVKRTEHAELSRETVRRRLKENQLKPWQQDMWCIPQVDGTYVARMEDVLDLYAETPDRKRPVVCFGVSGAGSPPHTATAGDPLHTQACELAEYGRARDRRASRSVPRPTHWRPQEIDLGNRCLGKATQQGQSADQMDVQHREGAQQACPCLSSTREGVIICVQRY